MRYYYQRLVFFVMFFSNKNKRLITFSTVRDVLARSLITQEEWLMLKECNGYTVSQG